MRLTVFGFKSLLFYLAMAAAFVAAPYSNVFFLLVSFLTLQWILSGLWTYRNALGASACIGQIDAMPAHAGGEARATIESGKRLCFRLGVSLTLDGEAPVQAQSATVRRSAEVLLRLPPLARGIYPVRRAHLFSTYPLGMLERRLPLDCPSEVVVYPEPAGLADARSGLEVLAEALGQGGGSGDMQPSGLRDFREGDGLRSIHWRASARRSSLVVKEWEGGGGQGLEVLLDRRCAGDELEASLSLLSALIHVARDNKEVLAIYSQGMNATFGDGHRPWSEALRFLAGATPLPASAAAPPPVSPSVTQLPRALAAGAQA